MKRITYTTILLLNGFIGISQCLVTENKEWSNLCHDYWNFWNYSTEYLKFTGDTVIDAKTYKKVERSIDELQLSWSPYGYIREDSNNKVFYKVNALEPERLLYDFNSQVDDTLYAYGLNTLSSTVILQPTTYLVVSIDSIQIGSTFRRQINLAPLEEPSSTVENWIDSTGNLGGLLHNRHLYVGCDSYTLLCFSENGIIKYQNPNYNSCYVVTEIDERQGNQFTVKIYPNPIVDQSTLKIEGLSENIEMQIDFFDMTGQKKLSKIFKTPLLINRSEFSPGIYSFCIKVDPLNIITGKIAIY